MKTRPNISPAQRFALVGTLAIALVPASRFLFADPPAATSAEESGVHSLGPLPQAPATLPPGPHQDVYTANCLVCHSNRYVFMQPKFTHRMWEAEVTKMAHTYGAPIPPEQQAQIVEYLYSIRGKPDPAAQTVPGGDSSAVTKLNGRFSRARSTHAADSPAQFRREGAPRPAGHRAHARGSAGRRDRGSRKHAANPAGAHRHFGGRAWRDGLHLAAVDLRELITGAADLYEYSAEERGVRLRVEVPAGLARPRR